MAYDSGRRPFEGASKSNHIHIIKDASVKAFLESHEVPKEGLSVSLLSNYLVDVDYTVSDEIEYVIAVDGGDTSVPVKSKFPSSVITFFQFGANLLTLTDLKSLKNEPFISPESIAKLKSLERIKFTLPTKNIGLLLEDGTRATLNYSVRKSIYEFFKKQEYLPTLKWFLLREYNANPTPYSLASHPQNPNTKNIIISPAEISSEFIIEHTNGEIFLTDIFRLHELIDEDQGAGGIVGYLRNVIEHFILIDTLRAVLKRRKSSLKEILFIKDGPLGFFGQTANMHEPMRDLINFLHKDAAVYLCGIEKSGPFVDHALEIADKIKPGQAYLLSNFHIYKYIKPGDPQNSDPYGSTSYYGGKVIFKSRDERLYIVSIPTPNREFVLDPKKLDYYDLDVVLKHIETLKSDMYDNSLLPIALANKLVSLSDHPSSVLLEKFAKKTVK